MEPWWASYPSCHLCGLVSWNMLCCGKSCSLAPLPPSTQSEGVHIDIPFYFWSCFSFKMEFQLAKGEEFQWINLAGQQLPESIFISLACQWLVLWYIVCTDKILVPQNKEKSITLKTMEDGQVLLYSVSFLYFGALYQSLSAIVSQMRTLMHQFWLHLWFLIVNSNRILWMPRYQKFHIHGWFSTKRWKWILYSSGTQLVCPILCYSYLEGTFPGVV